LAKLLIWTPEARWWLREIHEYISRERPEAAHKVVRGIFGRRSRTIIAFCTLSSFASAAERPPVKCTENSPERRGEEGCSILAVRPFVASTDRPMYWHIDRFDSLEAAAKAAGPDSVPAEAHGSVWLMTVEPRSEEHRGGRHIAWIGPLGLPVAAGYTMRVQSSLLRSGTTTPVHTHAGPEVFYVVAGEQCVETPEVGLHLSAGDSRVLATGVVHRGRVTGPGARRALALILHDAAQPASHDLVDPPSLVGCK